MSRILVAAAVAGSLLAQACALPGNESQQVLDTCVSESERAPVLEEDSLISLAARLIAQRDELQSIWPRFAPLSDGFALGGKTVWLAALRTDAPPPWQRAGRCEGGWSLWRADTSAVDTETSPWLVTIGATRIEAAERMDVPVEFDWGFLLIATLVHESFHRYQETAFSPTRGTTDALSEPRLDAEALLTPVVQALFAVERDLLSEALLADHERRSARLCEISALRLRRTAETGEPGAGSLAHIERKEATAHWVGYRAATLILGRPDSLKPVLANDLARSPTILKPHQLRLSLYMTGAAVAAVQPVDDNWKAALERGRTFDDLLAETSASVCAGTVPIVEQLPRYSDYLRAAERESALTDQSEQAIRAADGPAIRITGLRPSSIATRGYSVEHADGTEYRSPELIEITAPMAAVRIEGHRTVLEMSSGTVAITVFVDAGLDSIPEASTRMPTFSVQATGLTINVRTPVVVSRSGNRIVVELQPRSQN